MVEKISDIEWMEAIELCCESKAAELRLIGYEHVTAKEVWECVSSTYTKEGRELALYRMVNDILSLKAMQFMNFMTISAYRGSSVM